MTLLLLVWMLLSEQETSNSFIKYFIISLYFCSMCLYNVSVCDFGLIVKVMMYNVFLSA